MRFSKRYFLALGLLVGAFALASDVQQGEKTVFATPVAGTQSDGGAKFLQVDSNGNLIIDSSGGGSQVAVGPDGGAVISTPPEVSSAHTPGICVASLSDGGSTALLANYSGRLAVFIEAPASNTDKIWLLFGTGATTDGGNGIPLSPGQSINDDHGAVYTGEIDFIPNSSNQSACAVEL